MNPLFRWPGGKRWLAPMVQRLTHRLDLDSYYEPFVGAGAVYFALQPRNCLLGDVNTELITTYRCVRDSPTELFDALRNFRFDKAAYYAARDQEPVGDLAVAARFLYLRQCAFAGIYRTNRSGAFNVPYGGLRRRATLSRAEVDAISRSLRGATLLCASYDVALKDAGRRSLVYADPPYAPETSGNNEQFSRYTDRTFGWDDQRALAKLLKDLVEQGAYVIASNADLREVRDLYPRSLFHRVRISRSSNVAPQAVHRRQMTEAIFVSRTIYRSRASVDRAVGPWRK